MVFHRCIEPTLSVGRLAYRLQRVRLSSDGTNIGQTRRRWFSSPAVNGHNGLHVGSVVVRKPSETPIAQAIEAIHPSSQLIGATYDQDNTASLSILVTPGYAPHALDPSLPVQILDRLFGSPKPGLPLRKLDTYTAVVDALPSVRGTNASAQGVAYAFLQTKADIASSEILNRNAEKPGSLVFRFLSDRVRGDGAAVDGLEVYDPEYHVQIPLAQTIFYTGLPSTLKYAHYTLDHTTGLLRPQGEQLLESQTVTLPYGGQESSPSWQSGLLPLTPFRTIDLCMGNIIRTMSDGQPASSELETAVSNFFKVRNTDPEPVSVWALVIPRDYDENRRPIPASAQMNSDGLSQIWKESAKTESHGDELERFILYALSQGGRLCKVLSGGGGWGKKAGLLSLDPDTLYDTRTLRQDQGWTFDFSDDTHEGSERQKRRALGEIVKQGEKIMFLTLHPQSLRVEAHHLCFGVVPSTIDSSSAESDGAEVRAQHDGPESPDALSQDVFGAMSESGLALTIALNDGSGRKFSSKLDPPHSMIVIEKQDSLQ